jgi:two-component system, NtrC family, response regulator AtoC
MSGDTTLGSIQTAPDSGQWTLVIVDRAGVRTQSLPADGDIVLGRDPSCDVVLDSPRVSRRHARLRLGKPVSIADLGSRNCTVVRGAPLTDAAPVQLGPGESFTIGSFSLLLIAESAAETQATASVIQIDDPIAKPPPAVLVAIARSPVRVLVGGDTGVGKELLAAEIHRLSGRAGRYVRLNCAGFSETLLESELFGYQRGAFTGATQAKPGLLEVASGGTVFLDEIGELPMALQAKLLRAIESREIMRLGSIEPIAIDVRFVAATNRDLPSEIARGAFRLDLYYRLAGVTVTIPPLSARPHRIVPLAVHFLQAAAAQAGVAPPRLSHEAAARLQGHHWPGNVRELRNVVERALVVSLGAVEIRAEHVLIDPDREVTKLREPEPREPEPREPEPVGAAPRTVEAAERQRIVDALAQCGGNQTRAAKLLGISRATLSNRIAYHRIPRPHA